MNAHTPKNADQPKTGLSYKDAGVDIDAGDRLIDKIKPMAKRTRRAGANADLGGFGGAFDLKAAGYTDPILISGTDGVGTKLRIAIDTGVVGTVGIDLVAMCVNDVLAQGALPLFFLDYYATGKLDVDTAASVISGIADGCVLSNCALIGGESAEMPGMYEGDDFDLAGFVVGAAERDGLLPLLDDMKAGDTLIGITSSGPHSNGYSLIRKIVDLSGLSWGDTAPFGEAKTLAQALLEPTRIYVKSLAELVTTAQVKGLAHITGGGITENVPRMLPDHLGPQIDFGSWERPPVFKWLQETGKINETEMRRAFNCGIGMVLCVDGTRVESVLSHLRKFGETAMVIGQLVDQ